MCVFVIIINIFIQKLLQSMQISLLKHNLFIFKQQQKSHQKQQQHKQQKTQNKLNPRHADLRKGVVDNKSCVNGPDQWMVREGQLDRWTFRLQCNPHLNLITEIGTSLDSKTGTAFSGMSVFWSATIVLSESVMNLHS